MMPDRYGEPDDEDERPIHVDQSVVDFESRRLDRESIAAKQREREQRQRLAETRATHAPLDRGQSQLHRQHQRQVTERADERRRVLRIANCRLCDQDGYRHGAPSVVCDHVDRSRVHSRGMAAVRAAMGWDDPPAPVELPPITLPTAPSLQAPAASQPRSDPPDPIPPPEGYAGVTAAPGVTRCQRCGRPGEVQSQIDVDSGWCWDCLCAPTPPPAMTETWGLQEPPEDDD